MKKYSTCKCVVWDLDNTLWSGILSEGDALILNQDAVNLIYELDRRGILCSIASKNFSDDALHQLEKFGLKEYFLYPQIGWNTKSESIKKIADELSFKLDTIVFIDDQPFEREEVKFTLPEVECYSDKDISSLLKNERFIPMFNTSESSSRRQYYISDFERKNHEVENNLPPNEFLQSLDLKIKIKRASVDDLQRAEELTIRTNQLNTTGYTYTYDELLGFSNCPKHILLVSSLEDKFGSYGTIGLSLIEKKDAIWNIKLLLMSCRVMSRGVGAVMLNNIISAAYNQSVVLRAEHINNGRNRAMYMAYKLSGFKEISVIDEISLLENIIVSDVVYPKYIDVCIDWK